MKRDGCLKHHLGVDPASLEEVLQVGKSRLWTESLELLRERHFDGGLTC